MQPLLKCVHCTVVCLMLVFVFQLSAYFLILSRSPRMEKLDLDPAEMRKYQYILKFDENFDNAISRAEIVGYLAEHNIGNMITRWVKVAAVMTKLDVNRDNRLSMSEIGASLERMTKRESAEPNLPPQQPTEPSLPPMPVHPFMTNTESGQLASTAFAVDVKLPVRNDTQAEP